MQFIDLSTFTVKEKVVLPYIVADIVDGENGHYYYSNKEGEIYSFNLSSKEIKKQFIADSFGYGIKADILLKVGNKSQLALTGSFVETRPLLARKLWKEITGLRRFQLPVFIYQFHLQISG